MPPNGKRLRECRRVGSAGRSERQVRAACRKPRRRAAQHRVDVARRLAPIRDGPDDEARAAAGVAHAPTPRDARCGTARPPGRCRGRRGPGRAATPAPPSPARGSPWPAPAGPPAGASPRCRRRVTRRVRAGLVAARPAPWRAPSPRVGRSRPMSRVVESPNSRPPPSSWLDEVRNTSGHCGHGLPGRPRRRRRGQQLDLRRRAPRPAGARCPRQSEPVSPPPRMTTRLPGRRQLGRDAARRRTRRFCASR